MHVNSTSYTFFLPWKSDILPAIGVITAATIRYELNIHADIDHNMTSAAANSPPFLASTSSA